MKRIITICSLAAAVCVACVASSLAQDTNSPAVAAVRPPVTSATGRFVVSAPDAAKASEYTRWAEGMAERFERFIGVPPGFSRQTPLYIQLLPPGTLAEGVSVSCGLTGGMRRYGLTINEYVSLDYEELLAAYCRLALMAAANRDGNGPAAAIPEWLSMGVAQNLDPAARLRNRRLVNGWSPRAERPGAAQVLAWEHLPMRWHRTRALCGMVTAWIGTLKPQGQAWRTVLDRLAAGQRVTPEWVAVSVAGVPSAVELDRAWSEWLVGQERMVQDLGAVSSVLVEQLRCAADVPAAELSDIVREGQPEVLTPRDLIRLRRNWSVRLAAELRAQQVQALTIGKAPELVTVGRGYADFFHGLARGASGLRLRWLLARAERQLQSLAEQTSAREAYLDTIERNVARAGRPASGRGVSALEKSRIEAYVDEAEKRFGEADGEQAGATRREGATGNEQGKATDPQDDGRDD